MSRHLRTLKNALRADLNASTERGRLIRSAGMTAGLKVGGTLLAFGASLLYARVLGPHGYGLYAYVMAWVAVLTIPAGLGLPQYLVREGAKFPDRVRWLCRWGDRRILISGTFTALLLALAVLIPQAAGARWLFVIAAPLPLLNSLASIRSALLRARGWVVPSQWPVLILGPLTALAALAGLWLWQGTLYPVELLASMTGAALLPLVSNDLQLRKASSENGTGSKEATLRAALPFMWMGGLYLINSRVDLIMLGGLKGAHDAGVYAVATRAATLVVFFLGASNMVIAPHIARLYRDGNHIILQRLLTASARRVLALSLPIAVFFILAAKQLLTYLYGHSYAEGAVALEILAGAQLLNVAAGATGTILNMTGHEKFSALGLGIGVILNISLNAALIPHYGIGGAAAATGVSLALWNLVLWYMVRRHLSFKPTAFGV